MTTLDLHDTVMSSNDNPAIVAGLKRLWAGFKRRHAERRLALTLGQLDDHLLRDIGVEPQDVLAAIEGRRAPSILFHPMRRRQGRE